MRVNLAPTDFDLRFLAHVLAIFSLYVVSFIPPSYNKVYLLGPRTSSSSPARLTYLTVTSRVGARLVLSPNRVVHLTLAHGT